MTPPSGLISAGDPGVVSIIVENAGETDIEKTTDYSELMMITPKLRSLTRTGLTG
jgi:hypothetical protein